jgi:2-polyprenyl-3-methyl-5-hydroxy-6-metoxy-1,4-benzoquinol methylase
MTDINDIYNAEYFTAQIRKSDAKASWQYGRFLRFAGVSAVTHPRFLDAGCGAGPALSFVKEQGYKVFGADVVMYPLQEAQKRAPGVPLVNCDLRRMLPFANQSFDVVLASEVIEHLEDALGFLLECRRVLHDGGCLILTTPNLWDIRRPLAAITRTTWSGYQDPTHINLMTPARLARLVSKAGFRQTKWRSGVKPLYMRSVRRLGWRLEVPYPPFIGNGIMFAAYK